MRCRSWGSGGRIGVNTGEVVTGTEERLATGDAVNVAARLEQAAEPGEVLIGEATLRLVREAVVVEPVEPLALKGKAEPVPAYRLLAVPGTPERSHASRFVGRARSWRALREAWDRAQDAVPLRAGDGGRRRGRGQVAPGRRGAGRHRGARRPRALPSLRRGDHLLARRRGGEAARRPALRRGGGRAALAARRGDRRRARTRSPGRSASCSRSRRRSSSASTTSSGARRRSSTWSSPRRCSRPGAPLLLLCMARPELLERRPSWPVPLRLAPLARRCGRADRRLAAGELRARIAHAAGGNPLFITEMLALADRRRASRGAADAASALGRGSTSSSPERSVLERGAVEGEVFHRGAVQALARRSRRCCPARRARPARADPPGAAPVSRRRRLPLPPPAHPRRRLRRAPKAVRADLHLRFADWLEQTGGLVELDEIVGYHLEQAASYEAELGRPDPAIALARGIGSRLREFARSTA